MTRASRQPPDPGATAGVGASSHKNLTAGFAARGTVPAPAFACRASVSEIPRMPSNRPLPLVLLLATALAAPVAAVDSSIAPVDPAPLFEAPPPSSRFT